MGKFFIFLAIGTHWIACYWFMVACSNLTGSSQQSDGKYMCTIDGWALQETSLTPFGKYFHITNNNVQTL